MFTACCIAPKLPKDQLLQVQYVYIYFLTCIITVYCTVYKLYVKFCYIEENSFLICLSSVKIKISYQDNSNDCGCFHTDFTHYTFA